MPFRTGKSSAQLAPWKVTEATVTSCKPQFFSGDNVSECGELASTTYNVDYEYEVNGKTYYGTYKLESPVEEGHTFELSYDPTSPSRNTGSGAVVYGVGRLVVWILGALFVAFLIYLENR